MKSGSSMRKILFGVKKGTISVEDAVAQIRESGFEDLGFARIDHDRNNRCGFPEVIFAESKEPEQIAAIGKAILARGDPLLMTRLDEEKFRFAKKKLPKLTYNKQARAAFIAKGRGKRDTGILIVTAGTSDIPVAEEAAVTCEVLGYLPDRLYDAGVAGIHRLLTHSSRLGKAKVIIVVAGMEGALPSVVGGLVDVPVIAVPTSVGYGASFQGITPLLSMLNSCASGVTVVNIDNGFGAAVAAVRIVRLREKVSHL